MTEPHKLSPTERLHEVTMAFATRAASPAEHSLEMTRNAKGVLQFTVTVRGHDLDAVMRQGRQAYAAIDAQYPYPAANGGE